MKTPVWVTAQAQISAIGTTLNEFQSGLAAPESRSQTIAIEIAGLDPKVLPVYACQYLDKTVSSPSKLPLDRSSALALGVVTQLLETSKLDLDHLDRSRLGVYWGCGMSGAISLDAAMKSLYADKRRIRPTSVVTSMPNAPAAEISLLLRANGPCLTYATACASSAVAIGEAMLAIASGRVDIAIVGGSESMLSPGVMASWDALRVLAQVDGNADVVFRPFDLHRAGFVLGEGAAALILETPEHALRHGRVPVAALTGYATNCDGYHMTNPHSPSQSIAMRSALDEAGLMPADIGYINAHGTGTIAGDMSEAESIASVFGNRSVPVSSTKSMHGHLLGGGGAVELMVALNVLKTGLAPHTVNLHEQDPKFELDLIYKQPRAVSQIRHAMSNSFAFGGTNAVLIASKID